MRGHDQFIAPVRITDRLGNSAAVILDAFGVYRLAVDAAVSVAGLDMHLERNIQVQNIDRALAVLVPGTENQASRDCQYYADFAVSVFLSRNGANNTTVDVVVQTSADNVTWREVDRQVLTINATFTTQNLNRTYACTRRYMRVVLINNTANVDAEVVTLQKPIG